MATYALTFATRAAFDTALAEGGDIYLLMQGVTSSNPSVAVSAHITETGETFACGTNVMIDIKSVGPGDYVLYDTTNNKFFGIASKWIDNNRPNQPTQHIMIFKTGVLPARFTVCGTVIKRFGNRIRLAGTSALKPWSDTNQSTAAWVVPTIPSNNTVVKKCGTTTTEINTVALNSFHSIRYQECVYGEGNSTYCPITRETWDSAVAAGNTTVTQNGKTATLADYNNNYDKFLAYHFSPMFPVSNGFYSDADGFGNTQKIVAEFIANHGKTQSSDDYAAGYCYNYTPGNSVPGLEKHSWFLGVMKDVGEVRPLTHTLLTPISWKYGILSTSSQATTSSNSGIISAEGVTSYGGKHVMRYVIPLADLIITV